MAVVPYTLDNWNRRLAKIGQGAYVLAKGYNKITDYYQQLNKAYQLGKQNQSKLNQMVKSMRNARKKGKGKASTSSKRVRKGKGRMARVRRKTYRVRRWIAKGGVVNVKNDVEGYDRTFYKQNVTDQEQKKINRRFNEGYSPFKDDYELGFQDTLPQCTNKAKWIWRCHNSLAFITKAFNYQPTLNNDSGSITASTSVQSFKSPEQAMYFHQFKTRYEIHNPTDYDINLVIYDIVCKQDTTNRCSDNFANPLQGISLQNNKDPITLINAGTTSQWYYAIDPLTGNTIADHGANYVAVPDTQQKTLYDITMKPTESYPFNIYFTIVKKKTYKLQPGATMVHVFDHRPKALMTRGYWGYRYGKDLKANDGDSFRGIKNITSGCLFKYWGQVAGSAKSTMTGPSGTGEYTNPQQNTAEVVNLSGRLMFREFVSNRWYLMNTKLTYTFNTKVNEYKPLDEEELNVVNDVEFKKANDDPKDEDMGAGD